MSAINPQLAEVIKIIDRRDKNWLQDIITILDAWKVSMDAGNYDHAYQDVRDSIEQRMKRKKFLGLF